MVNLQLFPYLIEDLEVLLEMVSVLFRDQLSLYKTALEIFGKLSSEESLRLRELLLVIKKTYKLKLANNEPLLWRLENYCRNI